ncbi:LuxR C-terminal-related transcriptional regulator [Solirubrobacter taibaiensis]|nr:LuxR C-terminal-related transcriptional regulator [Solirubrobacter taibaiensis]
MVRATTDAFVGRQPELEQLCAELAEAGPRVVLIAGAPGIGKTTLVDQFVATADAHVLRVSGDESEIDVPFGIVDQLLRVAHRPPLARAEQAHVAAGARLLDVFAEPDVVVVDDAQWVDALSLRALLFALRRLLDERVLVLLVVREDEAALLPEGLLKAAKQHVHLEPLDVDEVRALADALGVRVSHPAARRLREHGGGSPLHTRALLDEVPADVWERSDGDAPAPRPFAAVVAARLRSCPRETTELLEAAAVLGMRAPLATAAELAGLSDPFPALDGATAAGLLVFADGDVSFPHPLVRAAIHQGLSPERRSRLHTAAAVTADDEAGALQHRVAAATGPDEALATALEAHARQAEARHSWAVAATALQSASRVSPSRAARERRLLDAIAAALYAGDGARARALAELATDFEDSAQRDAVLAWVAMSAGDRLEAQLRLERSWATCDAAGEPALAAWIAERRAFLAIITLDAHGAVEWAERARALLAPDDPERARTTWMLALGRFYLGEAETAHAALDADRARFGPLAGEQKDSLLLAEGDVPRAREALSQRRLELGRTGSLVVQARTLARQAQVEFLAGAWDDAALLGEQAVVIATESEEAAAWSLAYWAAILVPAARGDFEVCDAHLHALADLPIVFEAHTAAVQLARAEVARARGDHAAVLAALTPLEAMGHRDAIEEPGLWPWPHLYAEALIDTEQPADAFIDRYAAIARARGARLMLARLARARGDYASADTPGFPYEQALTDLAHGQALRRARHRREAAARLIAAQTALTTLGARPALERCVRELDACGLTPAKRGADADPARLTPQERSLARLAARGFSNRDIAHEMLLSVKTVERHLTQVYRKLGIASRAELSETTLIRSSADRGSPR